MGEGPFLTIGIASYNYARYLRTAFEAIKRQRFTDYEVLYCDDGSTDDSVAVIQALMAENPQMDIRLVEGENAGVMGNKNRIIENARGKYVMLCDADDRMLDNCLETLCGLAMETGADQVVGAFRQVDEKGRLLRVQDIPEGLSRWTWGAHHGTLYKMQVIRDNGLRFDPDSYPDDMYFNMVFHDHSSTQAHTGAVVYDWNMHGDSASAVKACEDSWHGYALLDSCLSYMAPVAARYAGDEHAQIEYAAVKMYCTANLCRYGGRLGYFLDTYGKMRERMESAFPGYAGNPYVRRADAKGIVRRQDARTIWLFALAERTHTIRGALALYWLVSKLKRTAF